MESRILAKEITWNLSLVRDYVSFAESIFVGGISSKFFPFTHSLTYSLLSLSSISQSWWFMLAIRCSDVYVRCSQLIIEP